MLRLPTIYVVQDENDLGKWVRLGEGGVVTVNYWTNFGPFFYITKLG